MHEVIYKYTEEGIATTITRVMKQNDIAELLMNPHVELISVNATKTAYCRKKKKK